MSRRVIEVADHEEHSDAFDAHFTPAEMQAAFPAIPPLQGDVSFFEALDLVDEYGVDHRTLPVVMGWVCVNCNPRITSLPYVLARSKGDVLKCLRWLASQGCYPEQNPDFSAEVWAMENGQLALSRYRFVDGKLIPA